MYEQAYIANNFSYRSISTSSSFHRTEKGYEEYDQNRASLENRSQSSMSLDSLIRPGQMVAENEYTNNIDVETPMDVTETEIDYDEALSLAIQEATAMNPDMTVEKIEIQQNE